MTSQEIKALLHNLEGDVALGKEVEPNAFGIWEIAYQLAKQNELLEEQIQLDRIALTRNTRMLDRAEPGGRDAQRERGKCSGCRYWTPEPETARQVGKCWLLNECLTGSNFHCLGFETLQTAIPVGPAAKIFQRYEPSEPAAEAGSQQKEIRHPEDCSCPTCQYHSSL